MGKFTIIGLQNSDRWNKIVKSFNSFDVYYLSNYVTAFNTIGDGEPLLLYYEDEGIRGINVVMKRDISLYVPFKEIIPAQTHYDIVTPYGYGGFIFEGEKTDSVMFSFKTRYDALLNNNQIISEFVRYHPLINNANSMRTVSNVIDLGKTISMNLESEDVIWSNIISKNRNMIRKAQKNGVEIRHGKSLELFNEFRSIYNAAMDRDNATPYYYFEKKFYESIHSDLFENYEMFYAVLDEKIIAMSIILFANSQMHYHLSGTWFEYRSFAPTNILLYEAARWGCKNGFKTLHLGGGLGSGEDNLFKFKQAFNVNSDNRFSIGKKVCNQIVYDQLVEIRKEKDSAFNTESAFFPLYRSEQH
jgi:hypothetical protein